MDYGGKLCSSAFLVRRPPGGGYRRYLLIVDLTAITSETTAGRSLVRKSYSIENLAMRSFSSEVAACLA